MSLDPILQAGLQAQPSPQDFETGTVRWYKSENKFGLIIPDKGAKDVFFWPHSVKPESSEIGKKEGDRVDYFLGVSFKNDQPQADVVMAIGTAPKRPEDAKNIITGDQVPS